MRKSPKRGEEELVNGIGDRFAAAFVVTLFALIPCGVLWLALNKSSPAGALSYSVGMLLWALCGIALLGFLFPRMALELVGQLWDLLQALGKWFRWWL